MAKRLSLSEKLAGLTREEAYLLGKEEGGHLTHADLQSIAQNMLAVRAFRWCRARALHALAGSYEQGKLAEVLDELLDEKSWDRITDGARDADELTSNLIVEIGTRLVDTGWIASGPESVDCPFCKKPMGSLPHVCKSVKRKVRKP